MLPTIKLIMNTFLFTWNPTKWNWTTLDDDISTLKNSGKITKRWSLAASYKKIKMGDRCFLMKLGESPKGIIASGYVSSPPFKAPHWDNSGLLIYYVNIDVEILLNADKEPILDLSTIESDTILSKRNWTPQSSGIEIYDDYKDRLEKVWFNFLTNNGNNNPFKGISQSSTNSYSEGASNSIQVTKYERNPYARKKCLEHYGYNCQVCEFNFEKIYGSIGKNYIHVHHLKQVSTVGQSLTNPIDDLVPVCPNCHAMIHKRKTPFTIDEMKKKLKL